MLSANSTIDSSPSLYTVGTRCKLVYELGIWEVTEIRIGHMKNITIVEVLTGSGKVPVRQIYRTVHEDELEPCTAEVWRTAADNMRAQADRLLLIAQEMDRRVAEATTAAETTR